MSERLEGGRARWREKSKGIDLFSRTGEGGEVGGGSRYKQPFPEEEKGSAASSGLTVHAAGGAEEESRLT
jgi:hypothetical protein